ncbi:geranylgeranyl pyrophosphate synthase isoform X2 [Ooceraea biroi]|uniref:Geranylgeranyl pyrophosphate synthase n=2 Tax=Ooceraea biroi TaxID=2015173 RepID=A0A026WU84_OOCBI|nr:geranylgeranyl pyrophosphate synthase isoform X2 [Ooceraea biroi]XP_019886191.1 geranylgeranyl pyrophosphate synthase isoform X2 [Ooceraea biroi]EZA58644.1 Geranylgeranyl pyrophosphate synthase [Ooceraea biroi]
MNADKPDVFYYSITGNQREDEKLLEPIRYILQVPGKQIRAKLAKAFNYWLKISDDRLQTIDEIVNMLHNSSILIDDIQDNSILRRGIPVAHSVYGIASTLSAANYVMFIALERVIRLQHPAATAVYMEQLLELHRGQGMDIFWRDNFICPSEADYKTMTIRKTGGLFNLAVRLMKLFSSYEGDFSSLIAILGLYFQIRDDYCNLCLGEYTENKSYCEDLSEGKFSFPIIHALTSNPDDRQIINILRQRPKDIEVKRYCIKLLEKFGSFEYTRNVLEELDAKARTEIDRLGGNPLLMKILDELKTWDTKEAPKNPLTGTF